VRLINNQAIFKFIDKTFMGAVACCVDTNRKEPDDDDIDSIQLKKSESTLAQSFSEMIKERYQDIKEVYDFKLPPLGKGTN
jgi:hypothetical protein